MSNVSGQRYIELIRDQKKEKTTVSTAKGKAPPWAKQVSIKYIDLEHTKCPEKNRYAQELQISY